MRIGIGGISHETNAFSNVVTDESLFRKLAYREGQEIIDANTGVRSFLGGYVEDICCRAHAHGIICNLFYTDDPAEVADYLNWGVDTILTNDYQRVAAAVAAWKAK